jgi:hypothetical protein
MALIDKVPTILKYIRDNQDFLEHNLAIFEILEGDLLKYIEEMLSKDLVSERAYQSAKKRIPPINIYSRLIEKLSQLYNTPIVRKTADPVDQEIVDFYVKEMSLDAYFADANKFFNSTKVAMLEPYLCEGEVYREPRVRNIASHKFLYYSDDKVDPLNPTIQIKVMRSGYNAVGEMKTVYSLTSNDEFMVIDSDGRVVLEDMVDAYGEVVTINPFGVIPATYINKSKHLLVPKPDSDALRMATLIPLLLTDLNEAAKYYSYSIVVAINAKLGNSDRNPGSFIELHSGTDEKGNTLIPDIKQIKPEVDIEKVITLIAFELSTWLESKMVRPGVIGKNDSSASGVSLMIQESDMTEARKSQQVYFEQAEQEFWAMMKRVHNAWASSGLIEEKRLFSSDFKISVIYPEVKPMEGIQDKILKLKGLQELGLLVKKQAVKELYPQLDEKEIEEYLSEIDSFILGGFNGAAEDDDNVKQEV